MKRKKLVWVTFLALLLTVIYISWRLTPTYQEVKHLSMGSDRVLKDRQRQVLQILRVDYSKRKLPWFDLADFPENLKKMLLSSEDKRFFYHLGVDPISLSRALIRVASGNSLQGGSTLTMQLVDLIDPKVLVEHKKISKGSVTGKLRQIFKAVFLELKWSKREILEAYINEIHLKGEFQGVPAMSYAYFNKPPSSLSDSESALIVSLISAPNQGRDRLKRKACRLLQKFQDSRCENLDVALDSLYNSKPRMPQGPNGALHLARRMFNLEKRQESLLSTIDRTLQDKVSEILARHLTSLKEKNLNDAAAIVIDNESGEVLAYIGNSSGYQEASQVDGVLAFRQAGSTLKPFVYARALQNKTLTTASILLDDPTAISWSGGVYRPANYDRHFSGPVSVREALASSLNVPAVKLVTMIGLYETYKLMQDLGLRNLKDADFYGVSMALGAVDVQLETLANAYRMLANKGRWTPLQFDKEHPSPEPARQVFNEEVSYIIQNILSDPNARTIGFGWDSPLETSFWTAVKTGTSKDYRDNWCVGTSAKYTVGVWAGNFNSEPMREVSGVSGAGPAWAEIMSYLHLSLPSRPPAIPAHVVTKAIKFPWMTSQGNEYFLKGTEPKSSRIEHALEKQVQIVFPAEGSVLVKNPHLASERQALFIRFKGNLPKGSVLQWNEKDLGEALSPFKIPDPPKGDHRLLILSEDRKKTLAKVHFSIK